MYLAISRASNAPSLAGKAGSRKGSKRMQQRMQHTGCSTSTHPYMIDAFFQCLDHYCEVDPCTSEPMVEELVSLALTTLFESVLVQEVSVIFPPASVSSDSFISVLIRAQSCEPLPTIDCMHLDCVIEDCLSNTLRELFGSLEVKRCLVRKPIERKTRYGQLVRGKLIY